MVSNATLHFRLKEDFHLQSARDIAASDDFDIFTMGLAKHIQGVRSRRCVAFAEKELSHSLRLIAFESDITVPCIVYGNEIEVNMCSGKQLMRTTYNFESPIYQVQFAKQGRSRLFK